MPVEFHFRKSDYEKYEDFDKMDIVGQEDVRTKITLHPHIYPYYTFLINKLKNHTIRLYHINDDGDRVYYATFKPPHRLFLIQRILSQHLALEYWAKKVNLNEFYGIEELFKDKPSFVTKIGELNLSLKKLISPKSINFVFNQSALGIFQKPDVFGIPLYTKSFAFSYSLACYLAESPLIYDSWRHWIKEELVLPMSHAIDKTIIDVKNFIQSLAEDPPSVPEILYEYLEKYGEICLTPVPPVDLLSKLQEHGYDIYDLQLAVNELYNKGIVDADIVVMQDGTKKFKRIWFKY